MMQLNRLLFVILVFFYSGYAFSQSIDDSISKEKITETISYLASDKLKGRVNYTKEQLEAAEFIAAEFGSYGLEFFPGFSNYYQPFKRNQEAKSDAVTLKWNNRKLDDSMFMFFPRSLYSGKKDLDDFIVIRADLPIADSLLFNSWWDSTANILLWINIPNGKSFSNTITKIILPESMPASDILIVGAPDEPVSLKFSGNERSLNNTLYNVVGMLPGKSKADEAIIFSAHYDHIDRSVEYSTTGRINELVGIFNGANDDASGTTAVLSLARYFSMRNDNERTLIFCLFAGEELGLFGSQAFVHLINPSTVKAVINIEMIGMTNRTGKNAFMVTGSWFSDLASILERNLKKEKMKVIEQTSDPRRLFERSDNYSFARLGIPAHTLMCSDDDEPCYHKPCDDARRIDMDNMTRVITGIAHACSSLIDGTTTPVITK